MTEVPALRASDADRDRAVALLRDHAAEGRLTLAEFTERMERAYLARTHDELEELGRDLPAPSAVVVSRRRPTRFLFSLFGSTEHFMQFEANANPAFAEELQKSNRLYCLSAWWEGMISELGN